MTEETVLARHSLADEIERLQPQDGEAGRRAEILVKEDDLRVTLVTMRSGVQLDEHTVPVSISIHILSGRFAVIHDGETDTLAAGEFIALKKHVPHTVRALEDGAFLLTLGWPASGE
jgi:quercetin dioxygenase-like cupin family protein